MSGSKVPLRDAALRRATPRYPSDVLDFLTSSLVTLYVVADPLLLSALFLGLTHGMSGSERREVAWRGPLIAFAILVAVGLGGAKLLDVLGISLAAFRIAGGLLLLWTSWEMVFDRLGPRLQATADMAIGVDHVKNVAAFPLATPLIAGPGAITAMILLAGRTQGQVDFTLALFGVAALVMLTIYLCFRGADRISKVLGVTGRAVSTRMLGIVLAALAVQFMIDGVMELAGAS